MTDYDAREPELRDWSRQLTQALLILDLQVDRNLLLDLAAESSAVSPSAGPISTFVVGYAAGLAAATGEKNATAAVESAAAVARQICATSTTRTGWVDTAQ
ncbi:hypothetical protein RCH23_003508 [Cryobacterium sp. CAN_C3]|uniref:DUF6457 domain-containing protein n=1 Tax=unclassified Cryobacterium TaxID=2649013 RepID=UPI0018CAC7A3|nr:DUF6457 domain-containing protein [Cryobacterium sp. CAN_C3]MEC5156099.1 hypothetical protein [Cryobacterium sp. CAN_C3]